MTDEESVRHFLDLARRDVLRGQPYQALGHLRTIQSQIDSLPRTSPSAEHELIYAGALAGMNDPGAEAAFEGTFQRISELLEPDPALEMRAHEDFGKYLAGKCAHLTARKHFQSAERIAVDLDWPEDAARIQMCIVRINLETAKDPRLPSFQNLKQAAKDGFTAEEQQTAWIHYCNEIEDRERGLVAARKGDVASVDYFRGVLSAVRRRQNELTV